MPSIRKFSLIMTIGEFIDWRFFVESITSLANQSYKNFELIIVPSEPIMLRKLHTFMRKFDHPYRISEWGYKANRSAQFSKAVHMAEGDYIAILDADDFLSLNALLFADKALNMFPDVDIFTSDRHIIGAGNDVLGSRENLPFSYTLSGMRNGFAEQHFWGFNRELVKRSPKYFKSPYICEDYWFFSRAALDSRDVLSLPYWLYYYRQHQNQMTIQHPAEMQEMVKQIQVEVSYTARNRRLGQAIADGSQAARLEKMRSDLAALSKTLHR